MPHPSENPGYANDDQFLQVREGETICGVTENAGVETAIRAKLSKIARVEKAGVET